MAQRMDEWGGAVGTMVLLITATNVCDLLGSSAASGSITTKGNGGVRPRAPGRSCCRRTLGGPLVMIPGSCSMHVPIKGILRSATTNDAVP